MKEGQVRPQRNWIYPFLQGLILLLFSVGIVRVEVLIDRVSKIDAAIVENTRRIMEIERWRDSLVSEHSTLMQQNAVSRVEFDHILAELKEIKQAQADLAAQFKRLQ